jgi:hypothetical protein
MGPGERSEAFYTRALLATYTMWVSHVNFVTVTAAKLQFTTHFPTR